VRSAKKTFDRTNRRKGATTNIFLFLVGASQRTTPRYNLQEQVEQLSRICVADSSSRFCGMSREAEHLLPTANVTILAANPAPTNHSGSGGGGDESGANGGRSDGRVVLSPARG
jgi:hypothetical protein